MVDRRTNLARDVIAEGSGQTGGTGVFGAIVPRSVRAAEAPSYGVPLQIYDPRSRGGGRLRGPGAGDSFPVKRRGLGRGLDALLPSAVSTDGPRSAPVGELAPNPAQPRSQIAAEDLEGLTASIAARGVIEPIVVRPHAGRFQIIAGERRWRAAQLAGLERVPVVVREASDEDVGLLALVENLQREDLNPIEEALAFPTARRCGRNDPRRHRFGGRAQPHRGNEHPPPAGVDAPR